MKKYFSFLICCSFLLQQAQARNWYVAANGNDANTNAINTPWQSITKVNASFNLMAAGDSVLFRKGDVFFGALVVGKSSIKFGSYSTGALPVVSGSLTLTSWTLVSPGLYKASASLLNNVNLVTINGYPAQIARYPNVTAADGGYTRYKSGAIGYIIDTIATRPAIAVNDRYVLRTNDFHFDNGIVTRLNGDTSFHRRIATVNPAVTPNFTADIKPQYGYFMYDKKAYCDEFREYWYDSTAQELYVFFGANNPASYVVKAAAKSVLFDCNGYANISVENIAFENAGFIAIKTHNGNGLTIKNVSITNSGAYGILVSNTPNTIIDKSTIINCLAAGINANNRNTTGITITNNWVKNSGLIAGMGSFYDPADYSGIFVHCKNALVENNRVDSSGYHGIYFTNSNVIVRKNIVKVFSWKLQDAGGIYTYTRGGARFFNRLVENNIVRFGIGNNTGTPTTYLKAKAYYSDGQAMNTIWRNNIADSTNGSGFHCNNCDSLTVTGNVIINAEKSLSFTKWDYTGDTTRGNIFTKNIFYQVAPSSTKYNYEYTISRMFKPLATEIGYLGRIDSNFYCSENEIGWRFDIYDANQKPIIVAPYSFDGFKNLSAKDAASKLIRSYKKFTVNSTIGSNLVSNGTFTTTSGWTVNGSSTSYTVTNNTGTLTFNSPAVNTYTNIYQKIGALSNAKSYLVRFKTTGTTAKGVLQVYLRMATSPYTALTPVQIRAFNTTPEYHELLFSSPTTNSNAQLLIGINQNSGTTAINDVSMYEVNATIHNTADSVKIIINESDTVQTVNLGARYITVDDSIYQAVSIQPRSYFFGTYYAPALVTLTPITVTESKTNVLCNGNATGTATVSIAGGKTPYSILWGNGSTEFTLTNLTAGTYTYTAKDSADQTKTGSITITQPAAALSATATAGPLLGNTATVTVTASGGTPGYNGTGNFTGTVGNNFYKVRDANGCEVETSVNILADPPVTPVISILQGPWIFVNQ